MKSLVGLLTIGALAVMVFGATDYEDEKAFMTRSTLTGCQKPADVIFLLDASTSIYGLDFRQHLDFVSTVIQGLGPSKVRCGLVTYGDQVRVEFGLRNYSSVDTIMKAVTLVKQLRGNTRTDLGLLRMREMMAEDRRSGVPQIGIVLTDGQSDYPADTRNQSEMAHSEGIALFSVGIGKDVDYRELRAIASHEENVFLLANHRELEALKRSMWRTICSYSDEQQDDEEDDNFQPLPDCDGVPLDLTFLLDHSIAFFPKNLQRSQRFVKDCLTLLKFVPKDDTHVSVITFGDIARLQFDIDGHSNLTDLRFALSRIGQHNARTDVANALSILGSSSERRHRKQNKKVAVIVTSGRVGDPQSAKYEASRLKKELGMAIFVVGVGAEVDRSELESMASNHSDQTSFLIDSYESLGSIAPKLMKTICGLNSVASKSPTPQQTKQPPMVTTGIASANSFTITATTVPIVSTTTTQFSRVWKTRESNLKTTAAVTAFETATESPTVKTSESTPVARGTETLTGQNSPAVTSTQDVLRKSTSRTSAQPRTPPNIPCTRLRPVDIVFAIPCSPGEEDTSHAMEFIKILGEQLGFDGEAVRLGVTPRFCPPHAQDVTVAEGSMAAQLRRVINHRLLASDQSNIVSQLRHLGDVSFNEQQVAGRSDAVKMAVVFFEPTVVIGEDIIREVNRLKRMGVVVVGILVGEEDETSGGLAELTSCRNCLLHAKSYADLDGQLSDRLATIAIVHRCVIEIPPE